MAGFRWWHHRSRHCFEVLPEFFFLFKCAIKETRHVASQAVMAQQVLVGWRRERCFSTLRIAIGRCCIKLAKLGMHTEGTSRSSEAVLVAKPHKPYKTSGVAGSCPRK